MTLRRTTEILRLAGQHHGLVRADMLAEIGVDRRAMARLTASGVLEPFVAAGIRRVAGSPRTPHQRLLASVWAAGPTAAASRRSAGWLWQLDPLDRLRVDVVVPSSSGRRPRGVPIHYSSDLASRFVTTVDGIPVTNPTVTLLDLAAVLSADDLECALDSALRQGLTSVKKCVEIRRRLARSGRNGSANFGALVDARLKISGVTDSRFEVRLIQVLRRGGLPEPVRQHDLYDADGFIGRFDCTYPEALVAIEADSVKYHFSQKQFQADRERRVRAEAIGWRVPTFTWDHVTRRPKWVAATTAAILDAAGWDWRQAA